MQPVGVGVTLTIGEVLDPLNDLVERFAWLALVASVSLGLQMTLGENRVATYPTHDKDSFDTAVDEADPAVVLIDGTDFPSIEARDVLKMFHVLPPTTARVLWGAELPYGRNLIELLEGDARGWVILELKEGISPLLDLVRSRRNARRSLL